jgi:DeoR/GlpR family transcriptional regulator of sugar metabolism
VVSELRKYNSNIRGANDVIKIIRRLGKLNILGGIFWTNEGIYEAYDDYKLKSLQNVDQKKEIAGIAVDKVDDDDIIILDSGTTCNELAKQLFQRISDHLLEDIDIIVCAASAVSPFLLYFEPRRLDKHANFRLHIPGGSVRIRNHAIITSDLIGGVDIAGKLEQVMSNRENIRKDKIKSFIGANYFSEDGCFYSVEEDEAINKSKLIGASGEVFILVDSNKCTNEKHEMYKFFSAKNLHYDMAPKINVVTDGGLSDDVRGCLEGLNINVLISKK